MSLELPITPGRYRTRGGEVVVIESVDDFGRWPVEGECGGLWSAIGKYDYDGNLHDLDLVSRIEDEPQQPNPLIAPLEWALGQLDESLDPDWQAAYKAATEALKLAKQK
jgi:hypothetical protein